MAGTEAPGGFYDPRSLMESDVPRASLHAKCVVVDGEKAFIGSANLTEAAQLRNIEVGVVVHAATAAIPIEQHFEALIKDAHLRRLRLSG